ncbi:integrase catalytic domain-containing protein [Trichonephila clavipes]|nr:integrase catalytic domain-containing protein [Trichonephila clavipes]
MPHHGILRPEKITTKLRVVFNATNPTSNGLSLNYIQYNGGLVQNDLFTIMIKFREHPYAFTADVNMMYRMVLIHESQQTLLRILWKESPEDPVKTFEMKAVTYGTLNDSYTKRFVLSTIARLFDPLGLLGPVVAKAKIFMQSFSSLKIEWTDELPSERAKEWHRFLEDFNSISSICIGRCIVHPQATRVELHGFADASEKCY